MIRVDEPTGISASEDTDLGALATPVQATSYKYDVFGKMVEVTQGVQKRWFKYDALGRLLRVRQPEQEVNTGLNMSDAYNTSGQWTAGFTYDVLGNVLTATDANGTVITNTYDKASRVTSRTYSDSTPAVSFLYDGIHLTNQPFAKGKLTKVTSSISETQYTKFDNFGRVTESQQKTPFDTEPVADATARISKYTYNFAGALVEEEYPSGRKITNEFEPDGDLAKVTSQKNSTSVNAPFVSNFSYTASGGISQMKLGNGRWETAKFNNRMQVTELGLGASASDAGTWRTQYEYGELQSNGTVDTAKNTGNIARQTLSFNGLVHPLVQSYKYDALYRITEATETANSVANWFQVWGYDRYGNRISFTQNIGGNPASVNPTIDVNTNRFNASQGFAYDKNGNVTSNVDPINSLIRTFLFNGDNKQYEVKDANGTATAAEPLRDHIGDVSEQSRWKIIGTAPLGEAAEPWECTRDVCGPAMIRHARRVRSGEKRAGWQPAFRASETRAVRRGESKLVACVPGTRDWCGPMTIRNARRKRSDGCVWCFA